MLFGEGGQENLKLMLSFNFFLQTSAGLLALLACSFIGGYLDKIRILPNPKISTE
jgi:hypothetical protein